MKIDPTDLTLDELEELEQEFGVNTGALMDSSNLSAKLLKGIAGKIGRRTDPNFDPGSLKLSELMADDAENPSSGGNG